MDDAKKVEKITGRIAKEAPEPMCGLRKIKPDPDHWNLPVPAGQKQAWADFSARPDQNIRPPVIKKASHGILHIVGQVTHGRLIRQIGRFGIFPRFGTCADQKDECFVFF